MQRVHLQCHAAAKSLFPQLRENLPINDPAFEHCMQSLGSVLRWRVSHIADHPGMIDHVLCDQYLEDDEKHRKPAKSVVNTIRE